MSIRTWILMAVLAVLSVSDAGVGTVSSAQAEEAAAGKVILFAGPSEHPPGTHEVAAGARLLQHCLKNTINTPGLEVQLLDRWPTEPSAWQSVAAIVFIGDLFPPERMEDPRRVKAELSALMERGCGLVCLHYATGLRGEHVGPDGEHPLLGWIGGYFATAGCTHHRSVARVVTATLVPASGTHPVLRGWKPFTIDDEPYWNNYFGADGPAANVTELVTAMLPPEKPQRQVVGWTVQRADGGRGAGIVVPHYYQNWRVDDLRMLVVNAVFWAAHREIPAEGVISPRPELEAFGAEAVRPKSR